MGREGMKEEGEEGGRTGRIGRREGTEEEGEEGRRTGRGRTWERRNRGGR